LAPTTEPWSFSSLSAYVGEKLALAFKLISTPPGMAFKIVKNLLACADCRAVLKLVLEMTGRRIMFRDRNRFFYR
jgi:hypothetical protein